MTPGVARILPVGAADAHPGLNLMNPEPTLLRDVLSYFMRNPQAVDSLEGIARWHRAGLVRIARPLDLSILRRIVMTGSRRGERLCRFLTRRVRGVFGGRHWRLVDHSRLIAW